jgi:hypothetical protein
VQLSIHLFLSFGVIGFVAMFFQVSASLVSCNNHFYVHFHAELSICTFG